jgi:hypothetical protein
VAVRVPCPACRAALLVYNPHYLVVVNCHACGHEFLAEGENLTEVTEPPPPLAPAENWTGEAEAKRPEPRRRPDGEPALLTFCPMCGELCPESAPECPACGEALPEERSNRENWHRSSKDGRWFRARAQVLGVGWICLAYLILEHDFWLGGTRLLLPEVISGTGLAIPPFPLLASVLVCLAVFALAGQFWAVAVGGLVNYLVLFVTAWHTHVASLVLLAAVIVSTHITLHQAASMRLRE